MNKHDIILNLKEVSDQFISECFSIPVDRFFYQPAEKWSIAQNIRHLSAAAGMTRLAYQLPKFMVRLYTGRPNRSSRAYEELVLKYKLKLAAGGKASGRFIPKPISAGIGKEKILNDFKNAMNSLQRSIDKKWEDSQLDQYLAPHPLLGKLTLRELGYFTIYHTMHHHAIIKERLKDQI